MKYKLLLLDVDGTLVTSKDSPVSQNVINAISTVKNKIHISLCTGRTHHDSKRVIDSLGITANYHIIESGAKVLNPKGIEENIKYIPSNDIDWIVQEAKGIPAGYGYCANGMWVENQKEIGNQMVTTVSLHSHSPKQTKAILQTLESVKKKYHIAIGSHWQIKEGNFILITHPDATKRSAIQYLQEKLGINREETIGVGDMLNDLPLFEASGFKIAMGNADDKLKAEADFVAPSIDKDGVAVVISKFLYETYN